MKENMKEKNIVVGMGEIGTPIKKILSKKIICVGYDINPKLCEKKKLEKFSKLSTSILHVCIPFNGKFLQNIIKLNKEFQPKIIVIHSTITPRTTEKLQTKLKIPVIYSATRGVHKRMMHDLKRYTKFFSLETNAPRKIWAKRKYALTMNKCGIKTEFMSNPVTLELAKIICDTSYYGWLITYSQISKLIADKHNVDYDEMWKFSEEIQKYLGNRPKMFPGIIGGHCVIPNLELIKVKNLNLINEVNEIFKKQKN